MNATIARIAQLPQRVTMPGVLLRLEGLALFAGAIVLYAQLGQSWWMFGLLLLAPDLAAIGYLAGARAGSAAYNMAHTWSLPLLLGLASMLLGAQLGLALALIWLAHIGMDRTVGYGLKYSDSFKHTHLSEV
jgi:Domain of unknown function (DUF4260)